MLYSSGQVRRLAAMKDRYGMTGRVKPRDNATTDKAGTAKNENAHGSSQHSDAIFIRRVVAAAGRRVAGPAPRVGVRASADGWTAGGRRRSADRLVGAKVGE